MTLLCQFSYGYIMGFLMLHKPYVCFGILANRECHHINVVGPKCPICLCAGALGI